MSATKKTAKKKAVKKPAKKVAKKAVQKSAKKVAKKSATRKPAKKAVAKKPAKKAAAKPAKKSAPTQSAGVSETQSSSVNANQVKIEESLNKFNDWAKKTFNQLFNFTPDDTDKQKLAAVDPTYRAIIDNSNKIIISWVSVGKIVEDGKVTTATRKWLLLWSNGDLGYVNRGSTRSPENAVSASGKNVKPIVNTNAFVKSISFDGYKMFLHGVSNKVIEVALDPKAKPNLEAAKKFATKVKKFI